MRSLVRKMRGMSFINYDNDISFQYWSPSLIRREDEV